MTEKAPEPVEVPPKRRKRLKRVLGCGGLGCAGLLLCFLVLIVVGLLCLSKVPKTYPGVAEPIAAPGANGGLGGSLAGFDSPYLGHTGSWDGKGGAIFGRSKVPDLDAEKAMGLKWTFMAVYWSAMEPEGPVDLAATVPPQWKELDEFVIAAQARGLNILMQAPVVGGNGCGPPEWAGRREPGKSAPANMDALVAFAAKLAARYAPDGTLARQQEWGNEYGVRAWELDNEPESYRTNWKGQAGDYAEFVTRAAAAIRQVDSQAVIVAPGVAGGPWGIPWLEQALDPGSLSGSPEFRRQGKPFSIGKATDVVSFHCYEGLATALMRTDRTIERDFSDVRAVFEKWENRSPGFEYERKQEYWHTEGNFDFFGVMSAERRAAWRFQFFTRGFAAGIRKLVVMDASQAEQAAIRAYVRALPNPFPMQPATKEVNVIKGQVVAFKHVDGPEPEARRVWVLWAIADSGEATVEIPILRDEATVFDTRDRQQKVRASDGRVSLELEGDKKMAPGLIIIDR